MLCYPFIFDGISDQVSLQRAAPAWPSYSSSVEQLARQGIVKQLDYSVLERIFLATRALFDFFVALNTGAIQVCKIEFQATWYVMVGNQLGLNALHRERRHLNYMFTRITSEMEAIFTRTFNLKRQLRYMSAPKLAKLSFSQRFNPAHTQVAIAYHADLNEVLKYFIDFGLERTECTETSAEYEFLNILIARVEAAPAGEIDLKVITDFIKTVADAQRYFAAGTPFDFTQRLELYLDRTLADEGLVKHYVAQKNMRASHSHIENLFKLASYPHRYLALEVVDKWMRSHDNRGDRFQLKALVSLAHHREFARDLIRLDPRYLELLPPHLKRDPLFLAGVDRCYRGDDLRKIMSWLTEDARRTFIFLPIVRLVRTCEFSRLRDRAGVRPFPFIDQIIAMIAEWDSVAGTTYYQEFFSNNPTFLADLKIEKEKILSEHPKEYLTPIQKSFVKFYLAPLPRQ